MSNLVPLVTPINNAEGVAVGTIPTAIFERAMDAGSISSGTAFLVEISKFNGDNLDDFLSQASINDIVPAKVTSERINLLDEDPFTGLDFGTGGTPGELYRTRLNIKPDNLLKPNTTYAAILGKDLSLVSVFDPDPDGGNSGTGTLLSQGVFEDLTSDTYTITIASTGGKNDAKFAWTRTSDAFTSVSIEARSRFVNIDKGLELKFTDGTYDVGDTFTIEAIPADKQQEIFSWTFSTGSGDYKTPDDERSGDLLDIPVVGGSSGSSSTGFQVLSVSPANGDSLVKIPRKANVGVGDVDFITLLYTSAFNDYSVEFLDGGTAGSEVVAIVSGTEIQITLEDGVSTATQVVDAFNASGLVNGDFEASTESGTTLQTEEDKKDFSAGVDATVITVKFNKDINAATITDKIKVLTQPIYPAGSSEEVNFTTNVVGDILTITLTE